MNSNNNIINLNYFDKCSKEIIKFPNNGTEYNSTYIIKNQKMITDFYYLPELIDYEKKYPDIIRYEEQLPSTYMNSKGEEIRGEDPACN